MVKRESVVITSGSGNNCARELIGFSLRRARTRIRGSDKRSGGEEGDFIDGHR